MALLEINIIRVYGDGQVTIGKVTPETLSSSKTETMARPPEAAVPSQAKFEQAEKHVSLFERVIGLYEKTKSAISAVLTALPW